MFAASLTDKLTGLERYDINSIGTNNGAKKIGIPGGQNNLRNFTPCFINPNKVTPKKIKPAKQNVTII